MNLCLATNACGTRFELVLAGDETDTGEPGDCPGSPPVSPPISPAEVRLRSIGEEALALIEEVDRTFSLFRRDSLLARINRLAAFESVALDRDAFELCRVALGVWRASKGAFDPALAPHMRAAGFQADSCLGSALPALDAPSAAGIHLDATTQSIRFERPGIALDLGGIAKGHALDLAAQCLREAGVERALLQGGTSTVVALGSPPGMDGWHVELGQSEGRVLSLSNACLSVSKAAGCTGIDGSGHVLDPLRGGSAPAHRSACVIAESARFADAWSTALVVRPGLVEDALQSGATCVGLSGTPRGTDSPAPAGPWHFQGPGTRDVVLRLAKRTAAIPRPV